MYHSYPESVNLREEGSWLVLARTNYMLDEIERDIRLQGMLYKRNNKLPVSTKLLNAVEAWKKLNGGEIVPLVDIKDIYSYMSSQIGIERGHKTLKMADKEQYELEELVMHHGLLMGGRPCDLFLSLEIRSLAFASISFFVTLVFIFVFRGNPVVKVIL